MRRKRILNKKYFQKSMNCNKISEYILIEGKIDKISTCILKIFTERYSSKSRNNLFFIMNARKYL